MECSTEREAHVYLEKRDEKRISRSELSGNDITENAKITAKAEKIAVEGFQEEKGVLYEPSQPTKFYG